MSVVLFLVLIHFLPEFEVACKLLRVYLSECLYLVAPGFDVAHGAVEDDEAEFAFLALHVVEHDVVSLLQVQNAGLGDFEVLLLGLLHQENYHVVVLFVYLQEEPLEDLLYQGPL